MSDVPTLNRPAFFDGQQLTAADLTAVQSYHTELLWLHQRYLHDWGIVSGLAVRGAKGESTVTVAAGYAIDSRGRSIVLTAPVTLTVPAVVGAPAGGPMKYHVSISYADDANLRPVVRAGVCESAGAVSRLDAPLVRWQEQIAVRSGQDVVLGAVSVLNCKLAAAVDLAPRRSALPERQPYLYAGRTPATGTGWELWEVDGHGPGDLPLGVQVRVDTSEAGFGNTPQYQAQVLGERQFAEGDLTGVLDGHVHVEQASAAGFRLRMALPVLGAGLVNPDWLLAPDRLVERITGRQWSVGWLGVES